MKEQQKRAKEREEARIREEKLAVQRQESQVGQQRTNAFLTQIAAKLQ